MADRLLSARQVPGFNAELAWKQVLTSARQRRPFGTCSRFPMTSIGATEVVVRRFAPRAADASSTAGQLVATFPDPKTAKRAFAVLKSWRGQCQERLARFDRVDVGPFQLVDTPAAESGSAGWYLLSYGPVPGEREAGYFDAQGLVRVGQQVSVIAMRLVGQDYNYEPGREPMVAAVRSAAEKLSG